MLFSNLSNLSRQPFWQKNFTHVQEEHLWAVRLRTIFQTLPDIYTCYIREKNASEAAVTPNILLVQDALFFRLRQRTKITLSQRIWLAQRRDDEASHGTCSLCRNFSFFLPRSLSPIEESRRINAKQSYYFWGAYTDERFFLFFAAVHFISLQQMKIGEPLFTYQLKMSVGPNFSDVEIYWDEWLQTVYGSNSWNHRVKASLRSKRFFPVHVRY